VPNYKIIKLTQGKEVNVDLEDYEELSKYKWHYNEKKIGCGYAQRSKHVNLGKNKYGCETIYMHREILKTNKQVDHINNNTLDNRRCNLRECTQLENTRNTSSRKGSSSKYLGVHLHKQSGKWRVQIKINGKKKSLGLHTTELAAALIYDEAARKYFGKFANTNFN